MAKCHNDRECGKIMTDGLEFGEKTSLVCNFCKQAIKTGEKVYWPDDESHDVIVHKSCKESKK